MKKTLIVPPSTSHSFFSNPTVRVVEACCWGSCSLVICHWIRGERFNKNKNISSLSLDPRKSHVERLGSGVMKEKKYSAFKQAEYLSSSWLLVGDHLLRPRRHVQPDEVARKPHTHTYTQTQKRQPDKHNLYLALGWEVAHSAAGALLQTSCLAELTFSRPADRYEPALQSRCLVRTNSGFLSWCSFLFCALAFPAAHR